MAHNYFALDNGGEKKREPQSLAEYIELFYRGKIKSLPKAFVQRMIGSSQDLTPDMRSDLQRIAIDADKALDKSRQLLQISRHARPNRALEHVLREFARDIVTLHPVGRSIGFGQSQLFPFAEDSVPLKEIWARLYPDNTESKSSRVKVGDNNPAAESGTDTIDEPKNSLSKDLGKARRNVFLCAVLWRHGGGTATFSDVMRSLRESTLKVRPQPENIEDELLEVLLSLTSSESEKVGLYAEWANQTLHVQARRVQVLDEQLGDRDRKIERLTSEATERETVISQKEQEISALMQKLLAAQEELSVQKVHTRADFEELRSRSLGVLKKELNELENVEIALSRQIPKVETAKDVVKVVVDSLRSYIKDLEGRR